jgi:hypothetical protein
MQVSAKAFKALGIVLLVIFLLFGAATIVLYGPWGRSWALSYLQNALQESGWTLQITGSQGSLPEELTLHGVSLTSPQGDVLSLETVSVRVSLWRLWRKEVTFTKFYADTIEFHAAAGTHLPQLPRTIAYTLSLPNLKLTRFTLPNTNHVMADLSGRIKIEKFLRSAYARVFASLPEAHGQLLFLLKNDQKMQLKIDGHYSSLESFSLPFSGSGHVHFYVKGTGSEAQGWVRSNIRVERADSPLFLQDWSLATTFTRKGNHLSLNQFSAKSDLLTAKGTLSFQDHQLDRGSLRISIAELQKADLPVYGSLLLQGHLQQQQLRLIASSPRIRWEQLIVEKAQATLDLHRNEQWDGSLALRGLICGKNADAEASFSWSEDQLHFKDIALHSSLCTVSGSLAIDRNRLLDGVLKAACDDLHAYALCDPSWPLHGTVQALLILSQEMGVQKSELDLHGSHLDYHSLHAEAGSLSMHLMGQEGQIHIELQNGGWSNLFWHSVTVQAERQQELWPWQFVFQGDWNGPAELMAQGTAHWMEMNFSCSFEEATATVLSHPVALLGPSQFNLTPHSLQLTNTALSIGSGKIEGAYSRNAQTTEMVFLCEQVPLDLFSANPLDVEISGDVSLKGEFRSQQGETEGSLQTELRRVLIATDRDEPLTAHARLQARFTDNRLITDIDLIVRSSPLLHAQADLPMHIDLHRLQGHFFLSSPASASLSFEGKIEELLDFFDLGPNRLEGICTAHVQLTGSLAHPDVKGTLSLHNGRYENYLVGTEFIDLNATWVARRHELILTSLSAKDGQRKGKIEGTGTLSLLMQDHFPFRFAGHFARITAVNTQWVQAELNGTVELSGDLTMAQVRGEAHLVESDVSIPEHIPISHPDLVVTYLHAPERESMRATLTKTPYPLFFDYTIRAQDQIFISGRGLSSEWKGDVTVTGTNTNLELKGRYDLLSGEFHFGGRTLTLTEGSLIFGGKPNTFPQLNLAANIELSQVSILARLQGPLNNPILSFRSTPSLPTSVVLSFLLFDEDLSELNAIQAAQLMASLGSLSRESPSILERTRQALGVDRLRIVATPLDTQGGQTYALQVGKYVSRGVLFSVTQGAQGDSTNLGVEVDLGKGLIFQVEAQQEQEQGKFSLKWNVNY